MDSFLFDDFKIVNSRDGTRLRTGIPVIHFFVIEILVLYTYRTL